MYESGLILTIYNRTLQQTFQEYETKINVYEAVVEALHGDGEVKIEVNKLSEMPGKLEQLAKRFFTAKPGLRERAEQQILNMIEAFEKELAEGKITLDLFTQEELALPFQRLQTEMGEQFTQARPTEEMRQRVAEVIVQAINEMMTPERFRRLCKDVESLAKSWLRERKKWAAALQGELIWLDEDQYEENKFVIAAFLGQITRLDNDHKPVHSSRNTPFNFNLFGTNRLGRTNDEKKKPTFKTKPTGGCQSDSLPGRGRLRCRQAGCQRSRHRCAYRWLARPRDGDPTLPTR